MELFTTNQLTSFLIGFMVALLSIALLRKFAHHAQLLDKPNQRTIHQGNIPLVGGIGMFIGLFVSYLFLDVLSTQFWGFFGGIFVMMIVGVVDDFCDLSTRYRFIAQIFAACLMIYWGHLSLTQFGHIGFNGAFVELGWFSIPITIFCVVGIINALNMVDGVDGLAGSISLITFLSLAFLALLNNDITNLSLLLLLIASLLGFLAYNWRFHAHSRASVFMGDAGSMFLGFAICWFLIDLSQGAHPAMSPVVALWLFSAPLIDTITMMLRRVLKGRSPFAADREHFHHLLLMSGFSHRETVMIILLISAVCASVGIIGHLLHIPEQWLFYGFLLLFISYYAIIRHAWKVMRFLKRNITHSQYDFPHPEEPTQLSEQHKM